MSPLLCFPVVCNAILFLHLLCRQLCQPVCRGADTCYAQIGMAEMRDMILATGGMVVQTDTYHNAVFKVCGPS